MFTIRNSARDWFQGIRGELEFDFDMHYFCFIAGITELRKADVTSNETRDIVRNFPGTYSKRGRLIVALFLSRELAYMGITIEERNTVYNAISKLVKPDAQNYLSDEGTQEFNKFAHGGFDVLAQEWFDEPPRFLHDFLPTFHQKILKSESLS